MPVNSVQGYRFRGVWLLIGWAMVISVLVLSLAPISADLSEGRDKISHFVAYGSLMFWFGLLYRGWRQQAAVVLGFVGMGIGVEYLQGLTSYRSFEVADMVANAIGVALGLGMANTPLRHVLTWAETRL